MHMYGKRISGRAILHLELEKIMEKEILTAEHIQKYYGGRGNVTKAIDDISFGIREGEFVGIMGSSGSGKTTLLNCISTIDTVTAGRIRIDGEDITSLKRGRLSAVSLRTVMHRLSDFMNMEIGANLCVACGVLLLVYGGYYLLTALACEKMIFHYSERQ